MLTRAELLGEIMANYRVAIGVAGTHGKTTTATLIYRILKTAGKKVSSHIGADLNNAQLNFSDEYLVVEACEYNKSFLSLFLFIYLIFVFKGVSYTP